MTQYAEAYSETVKAAFRLTQDRKRFDEITAQQWETIQSWGNELADEVHDELCQYVIGHTLTGSDSIAKLFMLGLAIGALWKEQRDIELRELKETYGDK